MGIRFLEVLVTGVCADGDAGQYFTAVDVDDQQYVHDCSLIRNALVVGPKGGLPMEMGKNRLAVRRVKYVYDESDIAEEIEKAAAAATLDGFVLAAIGSAASIVSAGSAAPSGAPQQDIEGREFIWVIVQGSANLAVGAQFDMVKDGSIARHDFEMGGVWHSCVHTQAIIDRGESPLLLKQSA